MERTIGRTRSVDAAKRRSSFFSSIPQPPEHATPFQLNSILPKELARLREEKAERMKEVDALVDRDRELATKLGELPFAIRPNSIPSRDTLKQLEAHIEQFKTSVKDRKDEFKILKRNIVELLDSVGVTPDNTFQGDILAEDAETFDLTTRNMEGLRRYCQVYTELRIILRLSTRPQKLVFMVARWRYILARENVSACEGATVRVWFHDNCDSGSCV